MRAGLEGWFGSQVKVDQDEEGECDGLNEEDAHVGGAILGLVDLNDLCDRQGGVVTPLHGALEDAGGRWTAAGTDGGEEVHD